MKVVRKLSGLHRNKRPICLAVGFFDGVHLGHQEVLARTLRQARAIGGEAWAMTFDPHPLKILTPGTAPRLLTDTRHKLRLLDQFGMDGCLLIPFSRAFAATPAPEFLTLLENGIPTLHTLFMGHDWRFGHKGLGDRALMEIWARPRGIRIRQVGAVRRGGLPVSSTRIREAIVSGDLAAATTMLGRPYSMLGTVVPGKRIGRTLGYPTANLDSGNEATPPTGIYAVQSIIGRTTCPGVASYGYHPTVGRAASPLLEIHLLDRRGTLYRREIEVFFMSRLRAERKFASLEALVRQIGRDVTAARQVLASRATKNSWLRTLQRWHPEIIVPPTK